MSKNTVILKSYADDFSELMGVECKVISGGSKDLFAIAECLEHGALNPITAFDSSKSLIKICEAYFAGVRFQKEKSAKVVDELNDEIYVPQPAVTWKYESNQSKVAVGRWDLPKYVGPITRGAECEIQYLDKGDKANVYFSFCPNGDNDLLANSENATDSFGIQDNHIFYFAVRGEQEVIELMAEGGNHTFKVLDYKLVFANNNSDDEINYEIEITDNRESSGQLNVDVSAINGNMDDMLCATFEINKLPGTESDTQCIHLHFDGENIAASLFKQGDKYIIRPETNVTIKPIVLETGYMGYVLE